MTSTSMHNIKFKAPDAPNGKKLWTPENASVSVIKWYDPHPSRRFGFIRPHDSRGDIWFNWLTLLRNKIPESAVMPDMPVTFTYSEPEIASKQRSVVFMRIDDGE